MLFDVPVRMQWLVYMEQGTVRDVLHSAFAPILVQHSKVKKIR
jgi:hypothetical protein